MGPQPVGRHAQANEFLSHRERPPLAQGEIVLLGAPFVAVAFHQQHVLRVLDQVLRHLSHEILVARTQLGAVVIKMHTLKYVALLLKIFRDRQWRIGISIIRTAHVRAGGVGAIAVRVTSGQPPGVISIPGPSVGVTTARVIS